MTEGDEIRQALRDIHRYWFGELTAPDEFRRDKLDLWFRTSEETDRHIRDNWGALIPVAAAADWDIATLSREEAVALVVLLDQFPRNIFRGSGEAFACDAKARQTARALLAPGVNRFYRIERVALGIPFEHSEEIADQNYSLMYYGTLAVNAPPAWTDFGGVMLDFATKHRDIVRRFGRFPHRNAALGRDSTPEEAAFVAEKGMGY